MNETGKHIVKHLGTVTKTGHQLVRIRLIDNINCSTCQVKSTCGLAENDLKDIEITTQGDVYSLHELVEVSMSNKVGFIAVFFAYVLPFIILILTLLTGLFLLKEWQAGLLSIFMLIPYFVIIYFSKNTLDRKLSIFINKR